MLSLGKSSPGMLCVASSWLYSSPDPDKDDTVSVNILISVPYFVGSDEDEPFSYRAS